ncbi:MAG TPA: hypothetical protein DCX77_03810 [Acidimicrobiaceae bacterium]|nr:hypothetical protein [Acidimicrobiaceae bacterium]HAX04780.1 hypothetical protein [Acidimicrobiaceae bacterium]
MTATGAILCGGRSTRMGQDKASLRLSGRPMVEWVAGAMREAGVEPIVALGGKSSIALPIVPDELEQQGPLHVLINAVEQLGDILVCPCDVPLVSAQLFRSVLIAGAASERPVVLAESDRLQPLIGLYKKSSAELLRSAFDRGERGPKMALKEGDFLVVRATPEETQNINTPEQFDDLIAAFSSSKTRS